MNKKTFEPTKEQEQAKTLQLTPVSAFLSDYKTELGDGSKDYRGLESGFKAVDDMISGLDKFILLAGRSGAGKTTLALQLALGVARKGTPVIVYSLEMSRSEIISKLVQIMASVMGNKLYLSTIDLQYNDPNLDKKYKEIIDDALDQLAKVGDHLYIRDGLNGIPRIALYANETLPKQGELRTIQQDVVDAKARHNADKVLVVIDSVQDVVDTANGNQTQAEVEAVNRIVALQQSTDATVLCTAQKNKTSINSNDPYGDIMGSMSFIHKPNTVLALETPREMICKTGKGKGKNGGLDKTQNKDLNEIEKKAKEGGGKPMVLEQVKGRYTGVKNLGLTYYGAFGYFSDEIDLNYQDLFDNYDLK